MPFFLRAHDVQSMAKINNVKYTNLSAFIWSNYFILVNEVLSSGLENLAITL